MSNLIIVGGTGSFGNAFLEKALLSSEYSQIVIFSRDEKKQHDMRQKYQDSRIRYVIGDIKDFDSINSAMRGVDLVFHAAALKHVPTGELFPHEVIKTNCEGSRNVFEASMNQAVKKVVLLSTDKAVYPVNAMGMTKALAEKMSVFYSQMSSETIFNVVRYGNVLASRGSVVPLFIEKIQNHQDLPITNFEMTRFMLTLDDAVNLVEFALMHGTQGKLFVQKAKSFTLQQLVESLSQILGRKLLTSTMGARPGEKLHETLASSEELSRAVSHENYFEITPPMGDPYGSYYSGHVLNSPTVDFTSFTAERLSSTELIDLLKKETSISQILGL